MILPIYAYGQKVLKAKAHEIETDREGIPELIANMWDTMYHAKGVGLAAPQIGQSLRLFIVDTIQLEDKESEFQGIKQSFINPRKLDEYGDPWEYEEGCLSIPNIRGDVERQPVIRLQYFDAQFKLHTAEFEGINARVIQHEYDHLEGILFTELLKPLRKRRIQRKLDNIRKGIAEAEYPLKFRRN
jgi:peptide deformylase